MDYTPETPDDTDVEPGISSRPPIGCRDGISPAKTVLRGHVPDSPEYYAARAGDSPFAEGELLPAGMALPRPVPAWYHPYVPPEPAIPFHYDIRYEDDDLIVVDKPHFLPTTSNGRIVRETVQTRLRLEYGEDDIVPLHRLDRLTAGIVVCSRNRDTRAIYQQLFANHNVIKQYRALCYPTWYGLETIVLGMRKIPGQRQVVVDAAGVETRTRLYGQGPWVDMWPETGHTHQLRVLMDHLGSPIIGDDTYPEDLGLDLYDFSTPLELLARHVAFMDPFSGHRRDFVSLRTLGSTLE